MNDLERAIEENVEDTAARAVYADWLAQNGDPLRGELIVLSLGNDRTKTQAMIDQHAEHFLGALAPHQRTYDGEKREAFSWKYGFIHGARLSHNYYAEKLEGGLAPILRDLLAHPSGRFLAELVMTFNRDPNEDNLQELIDILAEVERPTIRKLHVGDFKYAGAARSIDRGGESEISWYSAGDLSKLWPAMPRLATLIVQSGSSESALSGGTTLGELALPNLRHFEFRTGGLESANCESIVAMRAPKLEFLDVWFGQPQYGNDCTLEHVQKLLARTDLPRLRHLGIMNCEIVDDVIPALAKSELLAQLTELDLSLGCMTETGVRAITEHRDRFAHLAKLDVSYNYLDDAAIGALKGIAKELVAGNQREAPGEDDDRYAAVGE